MSTEQTLTSVSVRLGIFNTFNRLTHRTLQPAGPSEIICANTSFWDESPRPTCIKVLPEGPGPVAQSQTPQARFLPGFPAPARDTGPVQGRRLRAALLASFEEVFVREPGCKYLSGDKRVVGGERGHTPTSRRVTGKTCPLIRLLKNKFCCPRPPRASVCDRPG